MPTMHSRDTLPHGGGGSDLQPLQFVSSQQLQQQQQQHRYHHRDYQQQQQQQQHFQHYDQRSAVDPDDGYSPETELDEVDEDFESALEELAQPRSPRPGALEEEEEDLEAEDGSDYPAEAGFDSQFTGQQDVLARVVVAAQSRRGESLSFREREVMVSVLCCVLEKLFAARGDEQLPEDPRQITMFHTERVPSITIQDYFRRIAKYTECSAEALVLSLIHVNRLLHNRPHFEVNALNIHRLILTAVLCSVKFFDDHYFNNAYFARVGGVGTQELNCLEVEFLALINFDLFVTGEAYAQFYWELCHPELHAGCRCRHNQVPGPPVNSIVPLGGALFNPEHSILITDDCPIFPLVELMRPKSAPYGLDEQRSLDLFFHHPEVVIPAYDCLLGDDPMADAQDALVFGGPDGPKLMRSHTAFLVQQPLQQQSSQAAQQVHQPMQQRGAPQPPSNLPSVISHVDLHAADDYGSSQQQQQHSQERHYRQLQGTASGMPTAQDQSDQAQSAEARPAWSYAPASASVAAPSMAPSPVEDSLTRRQRSEPAVQPSYMAQQPPPPPERRVQPPAQQQQQQQPQSHPHQQVPSPPMALSAPGLSRRLHEDVDHPGPQHEEGSGASPMDPHSPLYYQRSFSTGAGPHRRRSFVAGGPGDTAVDAVLAFQPELFVDAGGRRLDGDAFSQHSSSAIEMALDGTATTRSPQPCSADTVMRRLDPVSLAQADSAASAAAVLTQEPAKDLPLPQAPEYRRASVSVGGSSPRSPKLVFQASPPLPAAGGEDSATAAGAQPRRGSIQSLHQYHRHRRTQSTGMLSFSPMFPSNPGQDSDESLQLPVPLAVPVTPPTRIGQRPTSVKPHPPLQPPPSVRDSPGSNGSGGKPRPQQSPRLQVLARIEEDAQRGSSADQSPDPTVPASLSSSGGQCAPVSDDAPESSGSSSHSNSPDPQLLARLAALQLQHSQHLQQQQQRQQPQNLEEQQRSHDQQQQQQRYHQQPVTSQPHWESHHHLPQQHQDFAPEQQQQQQVRRLPTWATSFDEELLFQSGEVPWPSASVSQEPSPRPARFQSEELRRYLRTYRDTRVDSAPIEMSTHLYPEYQLPTLNYPAQQAQLNHHHLHPHHRPSPPQLPQQSHHPQQQQQYHGHLRQQQQQPRHSHHHPLPSTGDLYRHPVSNASSSHQLQLRNLQQQPDGTRGHRLHSLSSAGGPFSSFTGGLPSRDISSGSLASARQRRPSASSSSQLYRMPQNLSYQSAAGHSYLASHHSQHALGSHTGSLSSQQPKPNLQQRAQPSQAAPRAMQPQLQNPFSGCSCGHPMCNLAGKPDVIHRSSSGGAYGPRLCAAPPPPLPSQQAVHFQAQPFYPHKPAAQPYATQHAQQQRNAPHRTPPAVVLKYPSMDPMTTIDAQHPHPHHHYSYQHFTRPTFSAAEELDAPATRPANRPRLPRPVSADAELR